MGRAIDQDNRLDDHERRIKLMEDALEEMIQTRVHHVDLTDVAEEEFTPPAPGKLATPKKVTRKTKATATT